jgi:AcrR family transcriptional regulator
LRTFAAAHYTNRATPPIDPRPVVRVVAVTAKRTPKGQREFARLTDVATRVMAREGLGGATLGRVGAAAGVDKRMLAYYFGSREQLWAEVVRRFGLNVAEGAVVATSGHATPYELASAGLDAIWSGAVERQPELTRAYVVLAAGANSDAVQSALDQTEDIFVEFFTAQVDRVEANGYVLVDDRHHFVTAMFALLRGLLLEWSEHGDSDGLKGARETFKRLAASSFVDRRAV